MSLSKMNHEISQFSLFKEDRAKMEVFIKHPQGLKAFEARYI